MSDGKTHDFITYVTVIPLAALVGFLFGQQLAVIFAVAYLFSGLMFNGDLDTESTPYYRWNILRWMWLPYRKFGHRSKWTHGFIRGTLTRLLWVSPILFGILLFIAFNVGIGVMAAFIAKHWIGIIVFIIGLEAGSMSHTLADISSSAWKRFVYKTFGIRLVPGFVKKKYKS
jgi:uncharacterized metal-binding protein